MTIFRNVDPEVIGRIFVLVGIALSIAKWFGVDEISNWSLLFFLPGVFLTYVGGQKKKSENDR